MKQEPKPSKRIVSRGAYIRASWIKRIAFLGLVASAFYSNLVLRHLCRSMPTDSLTFEAGFSIVFVVAGIFILYLLFTAVVVRSLVRVAKMDIGVPLTRANAAALPTPESLVRASQEPMQTQETVLLRAATHTQETQEEQLLRAIAEEQT